MSEPQFTKIVTSGVTPYGDLASLPENVPIIQPRTTSDKATSANSTPPSNRPYPLIFMDETVRAEIKNYQILSRFGSLESGTMQPSLYPLPIRFYMRNQTFLPMDFRKTVRDRLDQLTSLQVGWDGYGGQPVRFTNALLVSRILDTVAFDGLVAPAVVPGSDGSVQMEWHKNGYDIEVDVGSEENVFITVNLQGTLVFESPLSTDWDDLQDWLKKMIGA